MQQNKKPSMPYWGKKVINFSIFFRKLGFLKFVEKKNKNEINIKIDVNSQYGVVMRYVLLC